MIICMHVLIPPLTIPRVSIVTARKLMARYGLLQGMMQGVLRGSGKQLSGAIYNFISFYVIGFPVGVVLAIVAGMGTLGMWIGLLLGCALQVRLATSVKQVFVCLCHDEYVMDSVSVSFQTLFYLIIIFTMNWEKESQKVFQFSFTFI